MDFKMNDTVLKKLQKAINGEWVFAAKAREAALNNSWKQFQLGKTPQPFILNVLAYVNYNNCLKKCEELFKGPINDVLKIFPVWICDNRDDEPSSDWTRAYVLKIGNSPIEVSSSNFKFLEKEELYFNATITLDVTRWEVGNVEKSTYYSSEIKLAMRGLVYCVVEGDVYHLNQIVNSEKLKPIPKPSNKIPAFSCAVIPALEGISEDVVEELELLNIDGSK
jgi:hypothetical protein